MARSRLRNESKDIPGDFHVTGDRKHKATANTSSGLRYVPPNGTVTGSEIARSESGSKGKAQRGLEGDGQKIKSKIDWETEKWKTAIILYLKGGSPTIAILERFIASTWTLTTKPKIFTTMTGLLSSNAPVLMIGMKSYMLDPQMLNARPIVIKMWTPDFDFATKMLRAIPLWVKFPSIPLNFWSVESLSRISSGLGAPLYTEERTTRLERISYARLLVEMDITRSLPNTLLVLDPNGKKSDDSPKSKRQLVPYKYGPLNKQEWQVRKKDTLQDETGSRHIPPGDVSVEDEWHTTKRRPASKGT
ncbi:hypothetical protein FXO37_13261 [Capsicum annuum]|nr:hypothetical protein FXO37_13261 [Capsicum annuum]